MPERLLLALAALDAPMEARPRLFQRAMGGIFDMILAESGRSSAAEQKEAPGTDKQDDSGLVADGVSKFDRIALLWPMPWRR
jgi:hypothetical protein